MKTVIKFDVPGISLSNVEALIDVFRNRDELFYNLCSGKGSLLERAFYGKGYRGIGIKKHPEGPNTFIFNGKESVIWNLERVIRKIQNSPDDGYYDWFQNTGMSSHSQPFRDTAMIALEMLGYVKDCIKAKVGETNKPDTPDSIREIANWLYE